MSIREATSPASDRSTWPRAGISLPGTLEHVDGTVVDGRLRPPRARIPAPSVSLFDATLDGWRGPVTAAIRDLIAADKVAFILEEEGAPAWYFEGNYPGGSFVIGYLNTLATTDPFGLWRKQVALGVHRRSDLYTRALYRSNYYEDWIVPARAYDSLGLSLEVGPRRQRALLLAHHERPNGRRFGNRGYGLVRALLPAFRTGVEMRVRLWNQLDRLGAFIDRLKDPLVLLGRDGRVLHQNPAVRRLLATDPYGDRLGLLLAQRGRRIAAVLDGRGSPNAGVSPAEHRARTPYLSPHRRRCAYRASG